MYVASLGMSRVPELDRSFNKKIKPRTWLQCLPLPALQEQWAWEIEARLSCEQNPVNR